MRKRFLPGLLLGLVLLGGMSAQAAEVTPELPVRRRQKQGFHLKIPDTTGPIVTDSALPQALGTASLEVNTFLAFTGGNFSRGWRRVSAGGEFISLSMPVEFYYGLAPRTEIQITIPYLQKWASQVGPTNRAAQFGGIGDTTAIVSVLPAIEFLPTNWVNIAAGIKIDLIGKNTAFTYTPVVALFLYY